MLRRLVLLSLRHRLMVLALTCAVLVWGGIKAARAPLDVFPDFVQPQVEIQTEAPGLTAEQVEQLVTRPVELAISGTPAVEAVRSESIQGLSVVTVLFKERAEIHLARQNVSEQLGTLARQLPDGVRAPTLSPLTSSTMDLLKIGLLSEKLSPRDLRTFADWTLKPRLLSVPGVAHINMFGGEVEQLQVQVHPERLAAFDLTIGDIVEAAKAATGIRGAGFVETPAQRIVIQTEGQMFTPEQLGEVVVRKGTPVVRMRDVARVALGHEPKFGDALVMGKPGVLMAMRSSYGANTLEVTHALEAALEDLRPVLEKEGITLLSRLHRPATFIENALANVRYSLLLGAVFVVAVLVLFLLDLRTALISFISIPLSLLSAVLVLDAFGVSLNTMTLGGFAVAIGVVVDDAIIDVENILRRLRENAALASPRPLIQVVLDASLEVRSAVVYATIIVATVFIPVLTMSGLQGRFFAPLGVAFVLSTMASLLVALTVTPALSLLLLRRSATHTEPRLVRALRAIYHDWLQAFLRAPRLVIIGAVLLVLGAAAVAPLFHGELLPEFREGHFVIGIKARPGTSLEESMRIGQRLSELMLKDERIATAEYQVGRAEQGEDTWGPEQGEFHVELKPGLDADEEEEVQAHLRELLKNFPGIETEVMTFLGDRIGETLSGETAQVVVNVFGPELDQLDATARQVRDVLAKVKGHADLQVQHAAAAPVLSVHLRPERLAQFGFRPLDVLETVETAYQGTDVAQMVRGQRVHELSVQLADESRREPDDVGSLLLTNGDGLRLPLRELADVELTNGRSLIAHEGARRRQTVTCNVEGRGVEEFVAEARRAVAASVKTPAGVYLEWSGAAQAQEEARRVLLLHSLAAAVAVVLLLGLVFPRPHHVALVLANLPFALVGGVLAVFAGGSVLSLGALVGFVSLFGISTRNSIMLVSHYQHLVASEGAPWSLETVVRGAEERFLPIVMTALVTALGVLPLALGHGAAGQEIEAPMAAVILGGLITSTALNLLVLPVVIWRWGRFEAEGGG
jgi:CzcA family heavy metal efflux pump